MLKSGLGTGVLVAALLFQMLPFFLLVVVIAHALGVTGGVMLGIVPALFFATVMAACRLAALRTRQRAIRAAFVPPRPAPRPVPESVKWRKPKVAVLIKTRAERYRDLKEALGEAWR